MDIRMLTVQDYEQAKNVWKICFDDSDEFIETYFGYAASINRGLGLFVDDKLLSDLFMLDFSANISGVAYKAPFLAGCATLPEARKKDYMRMLVKQALAQMKANGIAVSFLHPFLHAFYRKFGYETVAYVETIQIPVDPLKITHTVAHAKTMEQAPENMEASYDAFIRRYDNYFVRSNKRMDAWLRLLFADEGMLSYIPGNEGAAYAMYYLNGDVAEVFELVYFDDAQKESLLHSTGAKNVSYKKPAQNGEEFTMMRVLDPVRLLEACPLKEHSSLVLQIEDSFMETEYHLAVEYAAGKNKIWHTDTKGDYSIDIQTLAQLVTGSYLPTMQNGLQEIFQTRTSCYFEQY